MNPNYKRNDDIKRQNRMVYTIMVLSLVVLGILISISVISAKRSDVRQSLEKGDEQTVRVPNHAEVPKDTDDRQAALVVTEPEESTAPVETQMPRETESAPPDTDAAVPEPALPTFVPVASGNVSKGFSSEVPVFSMTMGDYRVHQGIDIALPVGSNVFAAAAGTVSAVWEDPLNGCAMRIEHSGGAVSTYYNLSKETIEAIKPGMAVAGGDVIGTVGDTTLLEIADEPHIHYELTIGGEHVDPCAYMSIPQADPSYEG